MLSNHGLKVLYVENDPALRGIIAGLLQKFPAIKEVIECATGEAAVEYAQTHRMNVALIDVSLGSGVLDGIATGNEIQRLDPTMGIVIYSQYPIDVVSELIDLNKTEAWSYVPKQANMNIEELVQVIVKTSRGASVISQLDNFESVADKDGSLLGLTPRQHVIISLLASGLEPKFIASKLEISVDSVRKDLSGAYSILVPDPKPGTDLRITSILKYQRLINSAARYVD